jgi:iron complex transport system ATP-binding protein
MLQLSNYTNFILQDITLNLSSKENLVILGSNGAGKTTLAKILSGIIPSTQLTIDNQDLQKLWGCERSTKINYIPTKLEVFDEYLSVEEFLKLSHFNLSISIDEILHSLQIEYIKNKPCKNLSSGESQLVLIASSILHNAKFTIFDEILANLDPSRQKQIFDLLCNDNFLNSKIIISHNLDFAYKLGWNILYIKQGVIEFQGKSEEFFTQENLDHCFLKSVKKIQNHIVVDL